MSTPHHCPHCGLAQEPGLNFCENCGQRMPVQSPPAPPSPVYGQAATPVPARSTSRPALATRKSRPSWLIPVLGVGCLGILCVGILAIGGYIYLQNQTPGSGVAIGPQEPAALPEVASEPTDAVEVGTPPTPTSTMLVEPPADEPPPDQPSGPVGSPQETFTRWPMDYSLQWELGENDLFITDINQDQSWIIGLKKPEIIVMVIPPDLSAYYPADVYIRVKVRPGDFATAGPYGVMCNFQDENNYYVAEIWGNSFGIGKMENGVFTPLTDPYWQTSQFISEVGPDGYVEIGLSCFEYSIGFETNGFGELFPVYDEAESFSGGAVALFGASSQEAVDMMMGTFYFKDLLIETLE